MLVQRMYTDQFVCRATLGRHERCWELAVCQFAVNCIGPETSLLTKNLQQADAAPVIAVTAVFPPA